MVIECFALPLRLCMVADSIHQAPSTFSFGVSLLAGARDDKKKRKDDGVKAMPFVGWTPGGRKDCTVDSTPLPRFLPSFLPPPTRSTFFTVQRPGILRRPPHCHCASTPTVQSILFLQNSLLLVTGKVALLFLDGLVIFISLRSQNWGWGFL